MFGFLGHRQIVLAISNTIRPIFVTSGQSLPNNPIVKDLGWDLFSGANLLGRVLVLMAEPRPTLFVPRAEED